MNNVDGLDTSAQITTMDLIRFTIEQLPTLSAKDVHLDDSCAICLNGFASILSEETEIKALNCVDADAEIELGITKLGCGHFFCRKESVELLFPLE
jgi:hypothetical protein